MQSLLPEPPPTLLPENPPARAALAEVLGRQATRPPAELAPSDRAGEQPADVDIATAFKGVAARYPAYSAAWARLAECALQVNDPVPAYAYARTGYHRGLDQLRRAGWKGHGPVPWSHEPNQGFLRCLHTLAKAADAIGEADEAARCAQFLRDCDPAAADALAG